MESLLLQEHHGQHVLFLLAVFAFSRPLLPALSALLGRPYGLVTVMAAVSVTRTITVNGGDLKKRPWYIDDELDTINGGDFIRLDKNNVSFCRFVCGNQKGLRDMDYLDELKALRYKAVGRAMHQGACCSLFGPVQGNAPGRNKRRRTEREDPEPKTIEVELPEFAYDGVEVNKITMVMKWETAKASALTIEVTAENLNYIRHALLAGSRVDKRRARPEFDGVPKLARWIPSLGGYRAQRVVGDKIVTRLVKPAIDHDNSVDPLAVSEALEAAKRWAEGEEGADGADGAVREDDVGDADGVGEEVEGERQTTSSDADAVEGEAESS